MLVADGEKGLGSACGLSAEEAMNLLQPLHAKIDEELHSGQYNVGPEELKRCEDNCHCGIYSDLAAQNPLKEDLYKKASSLPRARLLNCAQKTAQWACSDSLLETLKKEVEPSPNAL